MMQQFLITLCPFLLIYIVSALHDSINNVAFGKNYSMVLVGGGLDDNNKEIWNKIVELGGGKGVARFGVVAAAGEDPCCDIQSSFALYDALLTLYGAVEVYYIPVTVNSKSENSNPDVVAHIKTLTGFFFTGGDQTRITYSLYNNDEKQASPVLAAIRETLLSTGGVVAGTSAGTDCMTSSTMITGGASYNGLVNGTKLFWRSIEYQDADILSAYGPGGIGLFPHGFLDTHFANRGRQGRMIQMMIDARGLTTASLRAFAIDENTALVVTGPWSARTASVIGQRGVLVLDTSAAALYPSADVRISRVRATRISEGDSLDLSTLALTPADFKTSMSGRETDDPPKTSKNVFAEDIFEFDKLTSSLLLSKASSTVGVSKEVGPQVVLTVSKVLAEGETTTAEGFDGINPATNIYAYSYRDLWLTVAMQ